MEENYYTLFYTLDYVFLSFNWNKFFRKKQADDWHYL
jgi:hypothetical protein